jgi:hypothetical protein
MGILITWFISHMKCQMMAYFWTGGGSYYNLNSDSRVQYRFKSLPRWAGSPCRAGRQGVRVYQTQVMPIKQQQWSLELKREICVQQHTTAESLHPRHASGLHIEQPRTQTMILSTTSTAILKLVQSMWPQHRRRLLGFNVQQMISETAPKWVPCGFC